MVLDVAHFDELLDFLELMRNKASDYPEGEEEGWKPVPTHQKEWYFDDAVFMAMASMQRRWYSTYSKDKFQVDLRAKLMATLDPATIAFAARGELDDFELRAGWHIVQSRLERWEMLREDLGLNEVPDSFMLYRGSRDSAHAVLVVKAWLAGQTTLAVPHKGLSSWSFLEGDQRSGARTYFLDRSVGALFVAKVPIDDTFIDVFVDDAYFATHGLREAEIIVGTGDPRLEISAELARCRIQVGGQEFCMEQAKLARDALLYRDLWPE